MKTAVLSYDLKNTKPGDNAKVRRALESYIDTATRLSGLNALSVIPQWIRLELPDTTALDPNQPAGRKRLKF